MSIQEAQSTKNQTFLVISHLANIFRYVSDTLNLKRRSNAKVKPMRRAVSEQDNRIDA